MKVGVQTWGSEGDIRPFIGICAELASLGHEVRLVITSILGKDYSGYSSQFNFKIEHTAVPAITDNIIELIYENTIKRKNVAQMKLIMKHGFESIADEIMERSLELAQWADITLTHTLISTLPVAARKFGKKHFMMTPVPSTVISAYQPVFGDRYFGKFITKLSWELTDILFSRYFFSIINPLAAKADMGPYKSLIRSGLMYGDALLIASSPSLTPPMPDYRKDWHMTGDWVIPSGNEKTDPELEKFLNSGEPPVYITAGSMGVFDIYNEDTCSLYMDAVKKCSVRAVIQAKWKETGVHPDNSKVFKVTSAPHNLVFPKCSAIVHHGGAGTTHSSCRAGVPSIVIPHVTDQPYWAGILRKRGLSRISIPRHRLTGSNLADAIIRTLSDTELKKNSIETAKLMSLENGTQKAAGIMLSCSCSK